MIEQTNAIDRLLAGLIDYAGLYPPAGLEMRAAVDNYLNYLRGKNSAMLGRFVVDFKRLPELCEVAGGFIRELRLSIVAPPDANLAELRSFLRQGGAIDSIEIRPSDSSEVTRANALIPSGITRYFEVPVSSADDEMLDAVVATGSRAKLRAGGVAAEAIPSSAAIANMLETLARRRIPFKATAGLHHPVRSRHPLTYAADSPVSTMHGFLNLFLAASLLRFGGTQSEVEQMLDEEDPEAFSASSDEIGWRSFRWTADQLGIVRKEFAISFGSCSFEEPIHDLEALGWLR